MPELTLDERKQLEAMISKQRIEQEKKLQRYIKYKAAVRTSRYHQNAVKRLEKLEAKHRKSQRRSMRNAQIRHIELTEQEKEKLRANILEASQ